MSYKPSWSKSTMIFGGTAIWGLLLVGCVMVDRTVVAPPTVAGATYVGSKKCVECHEDQTKHFDGSTHSRIALKDAKGSDIGCEACHGAGSAHVKAGGSVSTIVNPKKSPESCFQCHLDKRGQFSLPNAHPVLAGQVSCVDCHNVHEGDAIQGSATAIETMNETCAKCHTAQAGPFVFEHGAVKEGCVSCHNPHGSVNQKMLVSRDVNLCLSCHLTAPPADAAAAGQISTSSRFNTAHSGELHNSDIQRGTCWSAGCHEAVHGSNANNHLRY
jgi:predicted CXXCH cytochrome family protein